MAPVSGLSAPRMRRRRTIPDPEEGVLGVGQKIVKANAAANEDLLDPGNFLQ